jgi:hypothetical protein
MLYTREGLIHCYDAWKKNAEPNDNIMFFKPAIYDGGGGLCAMNTIEMDSEKKNWRRLAQQGKVVIRFYNSKSFTHEDGNTWHFLVLQPTDEDHSGNQTDPMGIFILNEMVSGYIYAFKEKKHRDNIQKFVMKGLPQPN